MDFTPKQERNGAAIGGAEQNSAQPSADVTATVAGRISSSETVAAERKADAAGIMDTASDVATFGGSSSIGAGGDMWEWDAGLAVGEQAGEG